MKGVDFCVRRTLNCVLFLWLTSAPFSVDCAADITLTANHSQITSLTTHLKVPSKPKAQGTLFLWPGLQPKADQAHYLPIDNGVLQPVLTWGPSCAPGHQPAPYSSWWISAQYVNTFGHQNGYTGCLGGKIMKAEPGEILTIALTLENEIWKQTVKRESSGESVSFSLDLKNQEQSFAEFVIEPYDGATLAEPLIFTNTSIRFSQANDKNCKLISKGMSDDMTPPRSSNDFSACFIDQIKISMAARP